MNPNYKDWCYLVKSQASQVWPAILQTLAGLTELQTDTKTKSRGTSCPACGGDDRYSFKALDSGGWACRRCGGGDGWALLTKVNGWNFPQAVQEVARYLGIEPYNGQALTRIDAITNKRLAEQTKQATQARQVQEQHQQATTHSQRAAYALREWNTATPAKANHPYLISHKLPTFNLREINHSYYGRCLLIPLINKDGTLRNLERINSDGLKRPIKGAQKQGLYYQFGFKSWRVFIAEGWATGAAIHINLPFKPVVLCAMSAGNLENIATIARHKFPQSYLIIAADHDPAGIEKAATVAEKFGLKVTLPSCPGDDFCDMHIREYLA